MDPFCTSGFSSMLLQAWLTLPAFVLVGIASASNPQPDTSLCFDKRMKQLKTGQATVLATWAGVNGVAGWIMMFTFQEEQLFYFAAMNTSWGVVNLGVAWFIYAHHNEVFLQPQTLLQQMDHQRHAEKTTLFNVGLDLAFIATGFALQQHGQDLNLAYAALWKGFGASVIMQGAFLLVQDTIFYRLHLKNRRSIYPLWKQRMEGR